MIREFIASDIDAVLGIWLSASLESHGFVEPGYWESMLSDMREVYIPASETIVYENSGEVIGFFCLCGNRLAAIFVSPESQGAGVGSVLMEHAMARRQALELSVFKANTCAIRFYKNHGFVPIGENVDQHTGHPEIMMRWQRCFAE